MTAMKFMPSTADPESQVSVRVLVGITTAQSPMIKHVTSVEAATVKQ